jgi:alanine dehydrogenase
VPHTVVVSEEGVAGMRSGAVVVDVAVDQGGCIATTHETTQDQPVYERRGVLYYAVGNMPGAVRRTSTYALSNHHAVHRRGGRCEACRRRRTRIPPWRAA